MTTGNHLSLKAEGTLGAGSGNEIWSCGLKIRIHDTSDHTQTLLPLQSDIDEMAAGGAALWAAFIAETVSGGSPLFESVVHVTACKAAGVLGTTGRNDPDTNPAIVAPTTSGRGLNNTVNVNYQNAIVITMRGDTYVRGSGALGRFYLPCPNFACGAPSGAGMVDGLMVPATVTNVATAAAAFITALNSPNLVLSSGHEHHVANFGQSEDEAGFRWQDVSKVTVDNRPDSVRRRYSALSGRAIATHTV